MNRTRTIIPLAAVGLFLFTQLAFAQRASLSTSSVYRSSDGTEVPGAYSKLVRTSGGIALTLHTSELLPGAYTIWWVVYNNPENCFTHPCSPADDTNAAATPSVLNATGHVVGEDGKGNFGAYLRVGDTSGMEVLFGPGLLNASAAEIQPVVRYHGPVIPELMPAQISTFMGGCLVNACDDPQFAIHAAIP
jgi:hypothetical protein